MKFRVRLGKQRFVANVLEENATVQQLKNSICREAKIRDISGVQVSLNGVEVIEDSDQSLSSLGLVNGDMVYAYYTVSANHEDVGESSTADENDVMQSQLIEMGFDKEQVKKALVEANYSSVEAAIEILTNTEVKKDESMHSIESCGSNTGPSNMSEDGEDLQHVADSTSNPVFCRDGVSATLETLYNTANVMTHHQAVFVLIHALMLESGFCLKHDSESLEVADKLPVGWNNANLVKFFYLHHLSSSTICQVVLTSLGPFVYAHAWSAELESNSHEVKLVVSNYIRGDVALSSGAKSVYKNLHKVSRLVKNNLVHPLLADVQSYLGLTSPFSLSGLPPEIQLMILSQLTATSLVHLSATCKGLNVVCNDEKLWQFFCKRDFGVEKNSVESWKNQYKILHRRRLQLRRERSDAALSFYPEIPLEYPGFNPFLPRIPQILGGHHDLFPDFLAGQPRDDPSLRVLHPDNRSRSDFRLRTGERATRGTFFA